MKRVAFAAFVAFWTMVLTTLTLAKLTPPGGTTLDGNGLPAYTLAEIAEHASAASCWMAIEGNVYDLTQYVPDHPTRPTVLLRWCGKDATEGMRTKDRGRDHSPAAWSMLDDYLIGVLAE